MNNRSSARRIDEKVLRYLNDLTVSLVQAHGKPSVIHAVREIYLQKRKEVYGEDQT